jgi:ADP-heptose:LPS heptosyltransferase
MGIRRMKILIAPFAAALRNGKPNAKNPSVQWWETVIAKLVEHGFEVTQIGGIGEARLAGVSQHFLNWPLLALVETIKNHDLWLSPDSFLPHLCWVHKLKSGIVIFSVSDPAIFGHDQNINLIKDRKYLREFQFQSWDEQPYNEDAFIAPEEVVDAVIKSIKSPDRAGTISHGI